MKSLGLFAALFSLALGVSVDSHAKGGRSHASSHTSSGPAEHHTSQPEHTNDNHASESSGGFIREVIARPRHTERNTSSNKAESPAANPVQPGATAPINAGADAAAEENRRQQAERAAAATIEQQKRRDAEAAQQKQEQAVENHKQRQLAWEARCQIEPVMTDLAISTCREVWTKPAP